MREKIVFVHGFGITTPTFTDNFLNNFRENFDTYIPILPGYGGVERLEEGCTVTNYSVWLNKYFNEHSLENAHLVGFSLGGLVALRFANNFPAKIKSLTIIASPINPNKSLILRFFKPLILLSFSTQTLAKLNKKVMGNENFLKLFVKILPQEGGGLDVMGYKNVQKEVSCMDMSAVQDIVYDILNNNLETLLDNIRNPILLIAGGKDMVLTTKEINRLSANIKNISATTIEGGPHLMTITHPQETAKVIKNFTDNHR